MGLDPAAISSGQSGGLCLHRSFLAPGQPPPELQCLRKPTNSGKLSAGTCHWLPTKEIPEDAWMSPGELLLPFRLYNMVEEQLKWFTAQFPKTVLPRELLHSHLTEVISPAMLDEQSSYLGNRVAACRAKQQSLFFSCCGSALHKLAMTVLSTETAAFQCTQQVCLDTGKPIHQICISSSTASGSPAHGSDDAQTVLVAARGHHQVAIFQAIQQPNR
ncbi:hypothetical protein ABBQ32_011444 [Trebouxia sp. C0010 RCD-2024]